METKRTLNTKDKVAEIGQFIKTHRKTSGLTQKELADLAGIGKASIFDVEHGKTTVQLDTVIKILIVLNIEFQLQSPFTRTNKLGVK